MQLHVSFFIKNLPRHSFPSRIYGGAFSPWRVSLPVTAKSMAGILGVSIAMDKALL